MSMAMVVVKLSKWLLGLRNRHFFVIDAIIFSLTPVLALVLRLDSFVVLEPYGSGLVVATLLFLVVKLTIFYLSSFYRRCWRYASIDELIQLTMLIIASGGIQSFLFYAFYQWSSFPVQDLPRSLPLLDSMLSLIFIGGFRFSIRAFERAGQRPKKSNQYDHLLVVGAGSAGISIVQEMQRSPQLGLYPVAFVDDDPKKLNLRIRGLPVVGDRYKIPEVVRSLNIRRVVIAMPTAPGKVIREIVEICREIEIQTSTLPGIHEILTGRVRLGSIRNIQIQDLLRRAPVQMDKQRVSMFLAGKKVLITGAGGSIGCELCRQILKCRPAEMLLVGHGENSVFTIQQELKQVLQVKKKSGKAQGDIPCLSSLIADIRFPSRLEYAFNQFKPDIVVHAAAHKHVPMMELNSPEAVTNNVLGTKNLLDLALKYDVENFVMLSTDKAVNPTSVMGATKRVAEMLVLQAAHKSGKSFVTVRFGNVLGSRGSIVPTLRRQIANGGPVTITHPEICRYFMTIPEAAQLVLQAAVIGRGGEVFVLNMGQPIKIVDLAKDLIRLSGYEVDRDIEIIFTGLRPGEKLFEELFIAGEQYESTQYEKVFTAQSASGFVPNNLDLVVKRLCTAADKNDSNLVVFLLQQLVPEYTPQGLVADKQADALEETYTARFLDVRPRLNGIPDPSVNDHTVNFLQIEEDLHQALERQEFRLHYQPIVLLQTNEVVGFEAFLRWHHPEWGLISPAEFISVAEETGLIIPIGWWVLREACYQLHNWQKQLPAASPLSISVNLSGKQVSYPNFVKQVEQVLRETGLDPCGLRLEIAESTARENSKFSTDVLLQLRALGIQLQLDNFGRGYSSTSHLYRFPNLLYEKFDKLKVDRSIICQIDRNNKNLEAFQTIVTIAQDLGMDMAAVGVETPGQLAQLRALKFEYGQGYFFSQPLAHKAAREVIELQPQR